MLFRSAFAELATRHPGKEGAPYRRSTARIWFWGIALPAAAVIGLIVGAPVPTSVAVALTAGQVTRLAVRGAGEFGWRRSMQRAGLLTIGKYAEAIGLLRFHAARIGGRRPALIEYKGPVR